jgi:putative tryptophan/tyrosine transport system substrate-binding protein
MFDRKRREFVTLLGGAAAWPLAARAQQRAIPVIGFLSAASPGPYAHLVRAFRQGLSEAGYVEGRNVAVEFRWADGNTDQLPALAADLVRRQVNVMAVGGVPAALAAKAASATIPIVFSTSSDPVKLGLVASLNRPGGNLTGNTTMAVALVPKRFELLREVLPTAKVVALLVNPASPIGEAETKEAQVAGRILGLQLQVLPVSTERDIDAVFETLVRLQVGGLVLGSDTFFIARSEQFASLTVRHAVPAIFAFREFVAAGGLMAYSSSVVDSYRLIGVYSGRILKGEKPADLPVEQSAKVELFINMKTAKALGLEIPPMLLARADEVIE